MLGVLTINEGGLGSVLAINFTMLSYIHSIHDT